MRETNNRRVGLVGEERGYEELNTQGLRRWEDTKSLSSLAVEVVSTIVSAVVRDVQDIDFDYLASHWWAAGRRLACLSVCLRVEVNTMLFVEAKLRTVKGEHSKEW